MDKSDKNPVRVPAAEIGTLAADRLIRIIEGEPISISTQLEARLVIRGSTGLVATPVHHKRRSRAAA